MRRRPEWGTTPRESVEAVAARRGRAEVVAGCVRLVHGDYADAELIVALGGPAARRLLDGEPHADLYWFRVWGIRGLLYVWDDGGVAAVTTGLADNSWRVREMAAKVVARRALGDVLHLLAALREDPVPRVREAAERAIAQLTRGRA